MPTRATLVHDVTERLRHGDTITGRTLAKEHGKSERWGQLLLRDARSELAVLDAAAHVVDAAQISPEHDDVRPNVTEVATEQQAYEPHVPGVSPAPAPHTAQRDPHAPAMGPQDPNVEPQSRDSGWTTYVAAGASVLIAIAALVLSFQHIVTLAVSHGQHPAGALLYPVTIDLLLIAASCASAARRRRGLSRGLWPTVALLLGVAVSIVANWLSAPPELLSQIIATLPAVIWLVSYEVLLSVFKRKESV